MSPNVKYYCPCLAQSPHPPPPDLPSSFYSFHALHNLFYCEECDALRCNRCVLIEVSGYYCPNCLFEVPSASVRAEKNRCARNCFLCPSCRNTLTVVASDPPESGDMRISPVPLSTLGEPPFFLYCNHCRWDSAEVGITFEKPTGLAAQLQRYEDSAPESLEFERLKEHFEPFLRASSSSSSTLPASLHHHHNPITAAASSALARDIPGVGKYTRRVGRDKTKGVHRQEIPEYRSRADAALVAGGGEADVDFMRGLETMDEVAAVDQRWVSSWSGSIHAGELQPLRIPLHSKKSKRCPSCRHILIKPEQKAQSVRYKIKLVAAGYMPAITVSLPHAQAAMAMMKRSNTLNKSSAMDDQNVHTGGMLAGKTYPFHLEFQNPLYDPIQIRLSVKRTTPTQSAEADEKARRPPFAVSLPTTSFQVGAYSETWDFEDEDMVDAEDDEERGKEREGRNRPRTVGVLEKRANKTIVGGEVVIAKDARGSVKFNMLVSYTYRSETDFPEAGETEPGTPSRAPAANKQPQMKTFSFYTVVELGDVVPKETPADLDI